MTLITNIKSSIRKGFSPKKVLLLTAPRPRPDYTPLHFGDNRAPQGLGYVAAYLECRGHICKIVDLYAFTWKFKGVLTEVHSPWRKKQDKSGLNWLRTMDGDLTTVEDHSRGGFNQNNSDGTIDVGTDLAAIIEEFHPDFIGMYIHTMSFDTAVELSAALKQHYPNIPQMCGGPHPSVMPETLPNSFNYVVMGEGEESALDIIEGRAPNRMIQGSQIKEEEMDLLPWPNINHFWDKPYNWGLKLFGHGEITPTISLNTSRGCPFPCKFCGVQDVSGGRFGTFLQKEYLNMLLVCRKSTELEESIFEKITLRSICKEWKTFAISSFKMG